jgi:L-iditol 2-dehydrogenase
VSRPTVRALELSLAPHRALSTLARAVVSERATYGSGPLPALRLTDVPRPARPPGWIRVAPTLDGICGSDRKLLSLTGLGTTLTALHGFPRHPVVPGHEVVGTVLEADDTAGVSVGQRVVVDPLLGCDAKGYARCDRCATDRVRHCAHLADAGTLAPGLGPGFHRRYGGGWGGELVAPAANVLPVPDDLDDRSAVLAEPMAVAVHAVLHVPPPAGARVVVLGAGPIGLGVAMACTALRPDVQVAVSALDRRTDEHVLRTGATELLHGTGRALLGAAADLYDTPLRGTRLSGKVLEDGADTVVDCVGSARSLDDATRLLRPGGTLVLVGTAARTDLDLSLVWHRELSIAGVAHQGVDEVPAGALDGIAPGRRRTLEVALDVLRHHRPGHLVTHVFPLEDHVEALTASAAGPDAGAVKVAFAPRA